MDNDSLGTALPAEMKRIREVVIPAYQSIGPPGQFALALMQYTLTAAEKMMAEGDVVGMIRAYQELKEFQL